MPLEKEHLNSGTRVTESAWAPAILFLLVLWSTCTSSWRAATLDSNGLYGLDFKGFWCAAQRLNQAGPLYWIDSTGNSGPPYVFAPPLAELLRLLHVVNYDTGFKIWVGISITAIILSVLIFSFDLTTKKINWLTASVCLILSCRFFPTLVELGLGNINCLLLLFVSAFVFCRRIGSERSIAAVVVVGALFKTWFIGAGALFLFSRKWKHFVATMFVFGIVLLLTFASLGTQQFVEFVKFTCTFLDNRVGEYQPAQSIVGFARLHFAENKWVIPLFVNSAAVLAFDVLGYAMTIAGVTYTFSNSIRSDYENKLTTCIFICSLLLILPICDITYLLLALPLLWTLLLPPREFLSNTSAKLTSVGAMLLYAIATRLSWPAQLPVPAYLHSPPASLLVTAGFYWLSAIWALGLFALWNYRRHLCELSADTVITMRECMADKSPVGLK